MTKRTKEYQVYLSSKFLNAQEGTSVYLTDNYDSTRVKATITVEIPEKKRDLLTESEFIHYYKESNSKYTTGDQVRATTLFKLIFGVD